MFTSILIMTKNICAIFLVVLFGYSNAGPSCHEEEVLDPSGKWCYVVHRGEASFHDARRICHNYGGYHLATIPNRIDNNFLWNVTENSHVSYNFLWIGSSDITDSGDWEWLDGTPMVFQNWVLGSQQAQGSCAAMAIGSGKWDKLNCEKQYPFVCYGPAIGAPTDPPTQKPPAVSTRKPLRQETVYIKFVADAESMGDPNVDSNARIFYEKQREFIHQISDSLWAHPEDSVNNCTYYMNVAFYGYGQYEQQFDSGAPWGQRSFDNLLEGNVWNVKTTLDYNITDAISGVKKYQWTPRMSDFGYSQLVFLTARKDFTGTPSLWTPAPNFDDVTLVSMHGSKMNVPAGSTNIVVSDYFTDDDVNNVLNSIKCH